MKPHPRIRKTIKWGGAALTVLLVVVWIGSGFGLVSICDSDDRALVVMRGSLCIQTFAEYRFDRPFDWGVFTHGYDIDLWPSWIQTRTGGGIWLSVPLWLPALLSGLLAATAFRLDTLARRRARMNLCPKCHYDRTGLAGDAVCPECGTGSGTA